MVITEKDDFLDLTRDTKMAIPLMITSIVWPKKLGIVIPGGEVIF